MRSRLFAICVILLAGRNAFAESAAVDQRSQALLESQQQALAGYDAHFRECIALHDGGKLKTYMQAAECGDSGLVDSMTAVGYRYPDLINLIVAQHRVMAERLDTKKITWAEAQLQNAQIMSQIASEVQRRDLASVAAASDAQRAQAAQNAAVAAARAQQEQERANAQAQAQAQQQQKLAIFGQMLRNNQAMQAQQQQNLWNVVRPPQTNNGVNCTTSYIGSQAYTSCR